MALSLMSVLLLVCCVGTVVAVPIDVDKYMKYCVNNDVCGNLACMFDNRTQDNRCKVWT